MPLPTRISRGSPKPVRRFEVIAPDGRVFQFPRPSLLQRLLALFRHHADTAVISTAVLALVYVAGLAAQALDGSPFGACDLMLPPGTS